MAYTDIKTQIYTVINTVCSGKASLYQREAKSTAIFPYVVFKLNQIESTNYHEDWFSLDIDLYCKGDTTVIDNLMTSLNTNLNGFYYASDTNSKEFFRVYKRSMGENVNDESGIYRNTMRFLVKSQSLT